MIQLSSIRFRLSIWYFLSLAVVLAIVAVGSWFAMRASLYHAIDEALRQRLPGMRQFLEEHANMSPEHLNEELNESSNLAAGGGLFRIYDAQGKLIYESEGLTKYHLANRSPAFRNTSVQFTNGGTRRESVRVAAQQIEAGGKLLTIEVAEPLRFYNRALHHFEELLWECLPVLIVLATLGGYWISRRALAPVDRITQDARAISPTNLSARLAVPPAKDELQRLTLTLNQMLDRLESSFNRVRQFTADASHELRAPLTLIHTAAEFSLRRNRTREDLFDAMQKVLRESKRTTELVNNLLLLARADASTIAFEPAAVNLTASIGELKDQALMLAEARQIAISFQLPSAPVLVNGDESSLARLCLILIDNAIKYTPPGGTVSVELRPETDSVLILVRDTGIGIAKDDLPLIFDRFWRADKVRSREMGGTGLGLSIARWIVDQHGGVVNVESKVGVGSSFSVRLPNA